MPAPCFYVVSDSSRKYTVWSLFHGDTGIPDSVTSCWGQKIKDSKAQKQPYKICQQIVEGAHGLLSFSETHTGSYGSEPEGGESVTENSGVGGIVAGCLEFYITCIYGRIERQQKFLFLSSFWSPKDNNLSWPEVQLICLLLKYMYWLIFKRERKGEEKRNIEVRAHQSAASRVPPTGNEPTTQAGALGIKPAPFPCRGHRLPSWAHQTGPSPFSTFRAYFCSFPFWFLSRWRYFCVSSLESYRPTPWLLDCSASSRSKVTAGILKEDLL